MNLSALTGATRCFVAYYMPQQLFDAVACNLAWANAMNVGEPETTRQIMRESLQIYLHFYKEDPFEQDLLNAAQSIYDWATSSFPQPEEHIQVLTSLMMATLKYQPDGNKVKWRLLNGLRFTSSRVPVPARRDACIKNVLRFHLHLMTGKIPTHSLAERGGRYRIVRE